MIKTLGGVVLVVVDVIAVKALILASHAAHAAHHGSGVMVVGAVILALNVAAWWVLLRGGSKPKPTVAVPRRPAGSRFGGSR